MTAAVFDTLKATKTLIAAGVDQRQAEAHAETLRDAVTEGAATKADIAGLKVDMLKLAIGIVVANTALTVGLLRAFGQ